MLHIEQAIIVEVKYDKIKLSSIVDAVIITTNGFSLFKDKEKLEIIRFYAKNKGIIILTDSDSAGFKIRSYLKGAIKNGKMTHVYIPDVFGKEKRKTEFSKEGKLGVEGISKDILLNAFEKAGVLTNERENANKITKSDLFELGFSGGENSAEKRRELLSKLGLPTRLSTNGALEIFNVMFTKEEFFNKIKNEGS